MDLAEIGVSTAAVGVLAALIVQAYKFAASRVAWLPRTTGGATSTLAYGVAVLLMWGLASLGIAPEAQADLVGMAQTLLMGALGWGASQAVYNGAKAVGHAGTA